jgi:mRNA interferase HigB
MPILGVARMRVISQSRLKLFWTSPGHDDAEGPLRAWYTHVKNKSIAWRSWGDVKASFASASLVGNCVVFNIGGNKFRLVTRIHYASQKVFVLKVLTHAEYDQNKWLEECGCFSPPPAKPRNGAARRKKRRKGR